MVLFVAQQIDQPVVVPGIGGFPAPVLPEDELIRQNLTGLLEAMAVHVDAFLAVFAAAQDHLVSLLQIPVFHHMERSIRADDHAGIHPALPGQLPAAVDFEVFRIHGGAVVVFRCHTVPGGRSPADIRGAAEFFLGEIGLVIGRKLKCHMITSLNSCGQEISPYRK